MRRLAAGSKAAKPWRLEIRRDALVEDVLSAFEALGNSQRPKETRRPQT